MSNKIKIIDAQNPKYAFERLYILFGLLVLETGLHILTLVLHYDNAFCSAAIKILTLVTSAISIYNVLLSSKKVHVRMKSGIENLDTDFARALETLLCNKHIKKSDHIFIMNNDWAANRYALNENHSISAFLEKIEQTGIDHGKIYSIGHRLVGVKIPDEISVNILRLYYPCSNERYGWQEILYMSGKDMLKLAKND